MNISKNYILKKLIFIGNSLTVVGCFLLITGLFGMYDAQIFSFGITNGIRSIASVAISGCLISAIAYFFMDLEKN